MRSRFHVPSCHSGNSTRPRRYHQNNRFSVDPSYLFQFYSLTHVIQMILSDCRHVDEMLPYK